MICRVVSSRYAPASPCDEQQPGRAQPQEHEQAAPRGQQAEPVKLAMGQGVVV
jgi:hypothetical protein